MTLLGTLGRHDGLSPFSFGALAKFAAVRRQRRALARLDDAALRDLGLTYADVDQELARPVWDVPSNWRG